MKVHVCTLNNWSCITQTHAWFPLTEVVSGQCKCSESSNQSGLTSHALKWAQNISGSSSALEFVISWPENCWTHCWWSGRLACGSSQGLSMFTPECQITCKKYKKNHIVFKFIYILILSLCFLDWNVSKLVLRKCSLLFYLCAPVMASTLHESAL